MAFHQLNALSIYPYQTNYKPTQIPSGPCRRIEVYIVASSQPSKITRWKKHFLSKVDVYSSNKRQKVVRLHSFTASAEAARSRIQRGKGLGAWSSKHHLPALKTHIFPEKWAVGCLHFLLKYCSPFFRGHVSFAGCASNTRLIKWRNNKTHLAITIQVLSKQTSHI